MTKKRINTNRKGSRFVDKVKKYLEKQGWTVVKVSASKPFDLVGWDKLSLQASVFECRYSGGVKKAFEDLRKVSSEIKVYRWVARQRKGKIELLLER